ncbi:MAG: hypothetical protein LBB63_02830 [Holosporaceae bacterium]|jgi:ribonuclease-3|nr:hypothetical protein [Holosporaceae bacterium]
MALSDGVAKLEGVLGYNFRKTDLILAAMSHPGAKKGRRADVRTFERLEFLGDRVLGLSLSSFLYEEFPLDSEGHLAVKLAALAGTDFLMDLAKKRGLLECFALPGDFFGFRNKNSSGIADVMEAIFGAVFLDSDFETARHVIVGLMGKDSAVGIRKKKKDAKTQLQEMAQALSGELPVYSLLETIGAVHDPTFKIQATACGLATIGEGDSKKKAEQAAAAAMVKRLKKSRRR